MLFNSIPVKDWKKVQVVSKDFHQKYGTNSSDIFDVVSIDDNENVILSKNGNTYSWPYIGDLNPYQ